MTSLDILDIMMIALGAAWTCGVVGNAALLVAAEMNPMSINPRKDALDAAHAAVVHAIETWLCSHGWTCDRDPSPSSPTMYLRARHEASGAYLKIRVSDHPYNPVTQLRYGPRQDLDFRLTNRKQVKEPLQPIVLPLSDPLTAAAIARGKVKQRAKRLVRQAEKETDR